MQYSSAIKGTNNWYTTWMDLKSTTLRKEAWLRILHTVRSHLCKILGKAKLQQQKGNQWLPRTGGWQKTDCEEAGGNVWGRKKCDLCDHLCRNSYLKISIYFKTKFYVCCGFLTRNQTKLPNLRHMLKFLNSYQKEFLKSMPLEVILK